MAKTIPTAIVTGASRGLGRGIAVELAAGGYSVAINYAGNVKAANETAALCEEVRTDPAQKFVPLQADISLKGDRERLVAQTIEQFGRVDALVNNAGIAPRERNDITVATEECFDEVIRTNLNGPYFLTQAVVNHWLSGTQETVLPNGYRIVFVSSISAHTASLNRGEYCVSKAGLAMAVQLWALRLAAENVQVYELRPGIMETDMTSKVKDKYDALIADGLVPQRRWGTPKDLGLAVKSLLDGDFPFSTGSVIDVDGGFNLRLL